MINLNNLVPISLRTIPKHAFLLSILSYINFSHAQQHEGFSAVIGANIGHEDNIFRTAEEISDGFLQVTPALKLTEFYESLEFDAQYKGNYRQYADNSQLNYNEHEAAIDGKYKHTSKFTSELGLGYKSNIEEPGTTNAVGTILDEFIETSITALKVAGTYGTSKSIGQIRIAYDLTKNRYDNNAQSFRDYDSNRLTGTFYYRLAPKTRLLIEAIIDDRSYENTESFNASTNQSRYLMGVEWTATAKTTGIFKVGYQDLNYENEQINDISSLAYYLDMIWKPNTYTSIKLGADRSTSESAIQGLPSFISETYSVGVDHGFSAKSKIDFNFNYRKDDIDNPLNSGTRFSSISSKYTYALKRSLEVYFDYTHKKRSSDFAIYDYDSNIYMLGIDWLIN